MFKKNNKQANLHQENADSVSVEQFLESFEIGSDESSESGEAQTRIVTKNIKVTSQPGGGDTFNETVKQHINDGYSIATSDQKLSRIIEVIIKVLLLLKALFTDKTVIAETQRHGVSYKIVLPTDKEGRVSINDSITLVKKSTVNELETK